jgi:hypothetical protein
VADYKKIEFQYMPIEAVFAGQTVFRETSRPLGLPLPSATWREYEKVAFRVAFIFFIIYSFPWDPDFYKLLWHTDYRHFNYRDQTEIISFFNPQYINIYSESGFFGIASYVNVAFVFVLSVTGASVWGHFDRSRNEYNKMYYWVRVFARYRVAYGVIAWGYKKIFIMQMPFPSVGVLHVPFIDFFAKRLYWEQLGVVPHYEIFLGFAEFIPGLLMLFRRTATLGAVLAVAVIGNVTIANHAYDVGEHVPAFCLAFLALFVLWYDLRRIVSLLLFRQDTGVVRYYPAFSRKWECYGRLTVKWTGNFVFVILFGLSEIYGFTHNDFYKIPNTTGLTGVRGFYNVTEFRLNNKILPYRPEDSIRWQDAAFEDWSELSFKVANRPSQISMAAAGSYPRVGEPYTGKWSIGLGDARRFEGSIKKQKRVNDFYDDPATKRDISTAWEMSGIGSDRKWYFYQADTVSHILYMQNKNRYERDQKQVLHYLRPTSSRIILWGINEFKDSIYAVLDKDTSILPLLQDGTKPIPDWLILKK